MKRSTAVPLLRLALAALERELPNIDLARGLLRDVLADGSTDLKAESGEGAQNQRAVTIKRAAELLSLCTKTIRSKIARGEIPAIGSGRTTRVLMPDAVHALQQGNANRDPIADEAVALVRNRTRLRVVGKGRHE